MKSLRIALLGTRGIPGRYGGFETFADEISKRLMQRGHAVTVFARSSLLCSSEERVGDVRQVRTGTIFHKYLETPLHAITSNFYVWRHRKNFDVAIVCNAANSPFAWMLKLSGIPVVINVDGIERRRSKWSLIGKLWYLLGERCSVLFADRIVADADVIQEYYREAFSVQAEVIRYGYREHASPAHSGVLQKFNLQPQRYVLYVSRFEPENNPLGVVQAFVRSKAAIPLVMVGDAPYAQSYIQSVKAAADDRVIFTGYQFGDAYEELMANAALYLQATEVGGTHPALVEAMGFGKAIIANDVPEHREVLGDAGKYYPKNDFMNLTEVLDTVIRDEALLEKMRDAAKQRGQSMFSWDQITIQYEQLCRSLVRC